MSNKTQPSAADILAMIRSRTGHRLTEWRQQFPNEAAWITWRDSDQGLLDIVADPEKNHNWWHIQPPTGDEQHEKFLAVMEQLRNRHR